MIIITGNNTLYDVIIQDLQFYFFEYKTFFNYFKNLTMRSPFKYIFLITILVNGLIVLCIINNSKTDRIVEIEKSKSGQTYQWSESEGKEFLSNIRRSITSPEAWEKRAKQIRSQILNGSGLNTFPEMPGPLE